MTTTTNSLGAPQEKSLAPLFGYLCAGAVSGVFWRELYQAIGPVTLLSIVVLAAVALMLFGLRSSRS